MNSPDFAAIAVELALCNCGFHLPPHWPNEKHEGYCGIHRQPVITTALQSAYNAGAEDMRERAAELSRKVKTKLYGAEGTTDATRTAYEIEVAIRALPIPAPEKVG